MRDMLLGTHTGGPVWLDFLVVFGFFAVLATAAAKAYPRAIL
jgi:hypothetical protein